MSSSDPASKKAVKQVILALAREAAWAPLAVFIIHAILGKLFGHEPYVDPVMHFLGGASIAYFARRAGELTPWYIGTPSGAGLNLLAFGMACFAALLWEFGELFSDIAFGTHIQRNAPNTLRDLALGVAGAAVYLFLRLFRRKITASSGSNRRSKGRNER